MTTRQQLRDEKTELLESIRRIDGRLESMPRTCTACNNRESITLDEFPALCDECLDRSGLNINVGARVVDTICESHNGIVERMDNGLAIVRNADGHEIHTPSVMLIRVLA